MNVHGDTGTIDASKMLDYINKQFAADVATLIATRDELATRQGSLTAAEDAAKDRAAAKAELDAAKAQAKDLVAKAKIKHDEITTRAAALEADETAHKALHAAEDAAAAERVKDLDAREKRVSDAQAYVADLTDKLQLQQDKINADRANLDARIKAFQDKVAAISV
jgi:chromosome segregation ATPase